MNNKKRSSRDARTANEVPKMPNAAKKDEVTAQLVAAVVEQIFGSSEPLEAAGDRGS